MGGAFCSLRAPKLFNLRADPFERADRDSINYAQWRIEHLFVLMPVQEYIAQVLKTFEAFPPRRKPTTFSIQRAMDHFKTS